MRIPNHLSYSSLALWEKDREEFYLKYLAEHRAPRLPQLKPMAIGAAFDAYVKAALHEQLFGKRADPQFEFDTIFCTQVEVPHRDWARENGQYVFDSYKHSGAFQRLYDFLAVSVEPPRFEFTVEGKLAGRVPFLGKPDCRFVLDLGQGRIHVIVDWKVRGYCSKNPVSPSKGYMICRDGYTAARQSPSHGKEHSNYLAYDHRGLTINAGYLEGCSREYADQLSIYGWLQGELPGDENVVLGIEEIVAKPGQPLPYLRVATHRARVRGDYQRSLLDRITSCWDTITSGHIFAQLSREESDELCRTLEDVAVGLQPTGSSLDNWFNQVTRAQ
jgi:hypothetical protein